MLSIAPVRGAMAAATYFEKDNYYAGGSEGPSAWFGAGAGAAGLYGEVGRGEFERLLRGEIDADTELGTYRNGEWRHLAGWDLTFSAPKSVSLMIALGGDERLIAAHDAAVRTALGWIEREAVVTRIRDGDSIEHVHTGTIMAATFRHDLSRAQEPQVHTHAVVINATRDEQGQWRSLDSRFLYDKGKEAGQRYQHELAARVVELGYEIAPRPNGTFDLAAVPRDLIDAFSSRAKDVEANLGAQGLSRDTASGRQRDAATIKTRSGKRQDDRALLKESWDRIAQSTGIDLTRAAAVAREQARDPAVSRAVAEKSMDEAVAAVRRAARILDEREAAFADAELRRQALLVSFGRTTAEAIQAAIGSLAKEQELSRRTVHAYSSASRSFEPVDGWTTRDAIREERMMLAAVASGRDAAAALVDAGNAAPIVTAAREASAECGHRWTAGQIEAAFGLLTSTDRVTGVQGYAGTAKTTTVLATVAEAARSSGHEVVGLAPTASAALELQQAIGGQSLTVQRHVAELRLGASTEPAANAKPELWIVDEASMVGARSMRRLIEGAIERNARVILVGDVRQLGSVEAGRAFGQLQQDGMRTFVLDEIVRQTNAPLREAVYAAVAGDAAKAMDRLQSGGGRIVEVGSHGRDGDARRQARDERHRHIVDAYTALTAQDRARTIVIDPTREGRDALNAAIRVRMQERGELAGPRLSAKVLVAKGLTRAEQAMAMYYQHGDVVRFARSYHPKDQPGIGKGEYLTVAGVAGEKGLVQLAKADGSFVVWAPERWGSNRIEVYAVQSRDIAKGDILVWTRNDPSIGAVNGRTERIVDLDQRRGLVAIDRGRQGRIEIDLSKPQNRHWDHGYVQTAHAAQGRTADRVMLHAESFRANVINQRSFYVALSRARADALVVTDDARALADAIQERTGEKQAALDREATAAARRGASRAMREVIREPQAEDKATEQAVRRSGTSTPGAPPGTPSGEAGRKGPERDLGADLSL